MTTVYEPDGTRHRSTNHVCATNGSGQMEITRIKDHELAESADDICLRDDGPGSPVHIRGEDCATIHGKRIVRRECSVCGQEWGEGAVSQHERCAVLYEDDERRYADCWVILNDGTRLVSR